MDGVLMAQMSMGTSWSFELAADFQIRPQTFNLTDFFKDSQLKECNFALPNI
jgi:hypothetical protein